MAGLVNAPLPEGLEICGYRIVKKIAVGGFSIVYQACDENGHSVAIKEYLPSSLARRPEGEHKPYVAAEQMELYRIGLKYFFDEGRVLASIHHPNIVSVLNFFALMTRSTWSWLMNKATHCMITSNSNA